LTLALCHEILGDTESATKAMDEARRARPDHVPTLRSVAAFSVRRGKLNEAEPLFRAVLDGKVKGTADDKAWARRWLALVQSVHADFRGFTEALSLVGLRYDAREGRLEEVNGSPVTTVEDRRAQAQVLATQPRRLFRSKAIDCLLDIDKVGSLTPDDRFLLARLYEMENAMSRAGDQWAILAKARNANPLHMVSYVQHLLRTKQLAEVELQLGRLEDLEKERQSLFGFVEMKAQLLETRGQGDKAVELLRTHVQRKDARPEEVFLLVGSLARQKKTEEALKLCETAWGRCPPERVSSVSIGVLRAGKPTPQQLAQVESRVLEAAKQAPGKTSLLLNLADLADMKGDYRQAQMLYRQVLEKDAGNFVALNNLAWLLAMDTERANPQEALKLISTAIDRLGERPDLLDTRATVLLAQKQARQAIGDLERANAEARTEGRSFRLAQAYFLANDRTSAVRAFQEARQAGLSADKLHPFEQKAFQQLVNELSPR
jgi:tetratricopeptide (TPR) repeat protein